ncbi:MAG TPA: hypothetical protein VG318_05140 [Actinomycetota bacterium]|nr:hypothetical protein [Actinomycetota bacterium]
MSQKRSSRAIALVTVVWVVAIAAAFALATTGNDAIAQQGCRGGGGSPSQSASPSPSESDEGFPPSIVPSLIPDEKVPVTAADQDVTCKSTITIAYSGRAFKGKVGSDEPMCKRARKVQVRKLKKGNDPLVGRAVTNAKGAYTVPEPNAKGRFYASVAKSTTENDDGDRVTCQAAKSKTIRP